MLKQRGLKDRGLVIWLLLCKQCHCIDHTSWLASVSLLLHCLLASLWVHWMEEQLIKAYLLLGERTDVCVMNCSLVHLFTCAQCAIPDVQNGVLTACMVLMQCVKPIDKLALCSLRVCHVTQQGFWFVTLLLPWIQLNGYMLHLRLPSMCLINFMGNSVVGAFACFFAHNRFFSYFYLFWIIQTWQNHLNKKCWYINIFCYTSKITRAIQHHYLGSLSKG